MTDLELQQYYANLLILQYVGQPKAYAMIESLVSGVIMNQLPLAVQNGFVIGNSTIAGVTYPGAVGAQLDVLGKYAGVTRTGRSFSGSPITLDDADFTTLIKLASITNVAGSSLATIQDLLHTYFPNQIFVYDSADMQMSYLITSTVGDQELVELFITEGLLPKPMGVELASVVYIPNLSLFGYQSYDSAAPNWDITTTYIFGQQVIENGIVYTSLTSGNLGHDPASDTTNWFAIIYPMNTYDTYPTYEPYTWLTYDDGIDIV